MGFLTLFLLKNQINKHSAFIWNSKRKRLKSIKRINTVPLNLIIGIERQDSTEDYLKFEKMGHFITNATDICIDFINDGNKFFDENVDIVFWISAIEHNKIERMKKAIEVSMKVLKKGGVFISTWAFSPKTHWNELIGGTVLDENDAINIFDAQWIEKPDFEKIKYEYMSNLLNLNEWHKKRFGNAEIDYIHAGNVCIKQ